MIMRVALVACMLAGGSVAALADNDKLPAGAMTTAQITTQLQGQGFKVSKVETDDGQYKVKGMNAAGQKQKLKVNPTTGAVISTETDD